jgi:hypothetical protein
MDFAWMVAILVAPQFVGGEHNGFLAERDSPAEVGKAGWRSPLIGR